MRCLKQIYKIAIFAVGMNVFVLINIWCHSYRIQDIRSICVFYYTIAKYISADELFINQKIWSVQKIIYSTISCAHLRNIEMNEWTHAWYFLKLFCHTFDSELAKRLFVSKISNSNIPIVPMNNVNRKYIYIWTRSLMFCTLFFSSPPANTTAQKRSCLHTLTHKLKSCWIGTCENRLFSSCLQMHETTWVYLFGVDSFSTAIILKW